MNITNEDIKLLDSLYGKRHAYHGDADTTVTPIHTEEMVAALKKAGRDVRFTLFKGVGHGIQGLTFTKDLIYWLLSQKRG
jgi:dipeptidyl aminopeptidase/acylaminoacyl peptidase